MSNIQIGSFWQSKEFGLVQVKDVRSNGVGGRIVVTDNLSGLLDRPSLDFFLQSFKPYDDEVKLGFQGYEQKGRKDDSQKPKHSHYHKDVSQYDTIDVYAVCKIFDVQDTSGCLQHAIKKLLVTGQRGHKDRKTDIQNAIDTLNRLLELEHGKDK